MFYTLQFNLHLKTDDKRHEIYMVVERDPYEDAWKFFTDPIIDFDKNFDKSHPQLDFFDLESVDQEAIRVEVTYMLKQRARGIEL